MFDLEQYYLNEEENKIIDNKCILPFSEPTICNQLEKAYQQGIKEGRKVAYKECLKKWNMTVILNDFERWLKEQIKEQSK